MNVQFGSICCGTPKTAASTKFSGNAQNAAVQTAVNAAPTTQLTFGLNRGWDASRMTATQQNKSQGALNLLG